MLENEIVLSFFFFLFLRKGKEKMIITNIFSPTFLLCMAKNDFCWYSCGYNMNPHWRSG